MPMQIMPQGVDPTVYSQSPSWQGYSDPLRPLIEYLGGDAAGGLRGSILDTLMGRNQFDAAGAFDDAHDAWWAAQQDIINQIGSMRDQALDPNGVYAGWFRDVRDRTSGIMDQTIGAWQDYMGSIMGGLGNYGGLDFSVPGQIARAGGQQAFDDITNRNVAQMEQKLAPYLGNIRAGLLGSAGGSESAPSSGSVSQQLKAAMAQIGAPIIANTVAQGQGFLPNVVGTGLAADYGARNSILGAMLGLGQFGAQAAANMFGQKAGVMGALAQQEGAFAPQVFGAEAALMGNALNTNSRDNLLNNMVNSYLASQAPLQRLAAQYAATMFQPDALVQVAGTGRGGTNYGPTMGGEYKNPPTGMGKKDEKEAPAGPPKPPGGSPPGYDPGSSNNTAALAAADQMLYDSMGSASYTGPGMVVTDAWGPGW